MRKPASLRHVRSSGRPKPLVWRFQLDDACVRTECQHVCRSGPYVMDDIGGHVFGTQQCRHVSTILASSWRSPPFLSLGWSLQNSCAIPVFLAGLWRRIFRPNASMTFCCLSERYSTNHVLRSRNSPSEFLPRYSCGFLSCGFVLCSCGVLGRFLVEMCAFLAESLVGFFCFGVVGAVRGVGGRLSQSACFLERLKDACGWATQRVASGGATRVSLPWAVRMLQPSRTWCTQRSANTLDSWQRQLRFTNRTICTLKRTAI